jgi:class II lanthipeptide synthase
MISSRKQYLETADRIGARICRDAIWSGNRCNWLGDSMEKLDGSWKVAHCALGPDFYGGTSGIALFLDRLYAFTGERLFRETAEGAILQACSHIPHLAPAIRPSLYLGVTGIAYTLTAMGLEDKAREALRQLTNLGPPSTDAEGDNLDVIGGIAGAIPPLIEMGSALSDNALVALAITYGEDLLRLAKRSAAGWSWNTMRVAPAQRQQDLTGFSHGAAGIAWALSELFQYTKDARFRTAAAEARRYESSHFNLQFSNWPDFRYLYDPDSPNKDGPSYPISWCHGAPGIGLDRVRAYEIFGVPGLKEEAEIAMRTTETILTFSKGSNFSLCHGLGGNADLLIYASVVLHDPALMALPEQVGEQGIEQIERQDLRWPCGVTDGDETPNLMLGTAGVGYFYLRLYEPSKVPSVLILPAHAQERMLAVPSA